MKAAGPKITVVTAVYNRVQTIEGCIQSVLSQTAADRVEQIVIDGNSTDGTDLVVRQFEGRLAKSIREPDSGIYDALNKGIRAASSEIVGFLHADDVLASDNILEMIVDAFQSGNHDAIYGDLVYVDSEDIGHVVRYWKSGPYDRNRFRWGWMPPHPTVYVRRSIYEQFGGYRTDLGSAADYECMVRLMFKAGIRVGYVPKVLVRMRLGGKSNSSIANRMKANRSDRQAWLENGLRPPFGLRFTKPFRKLGQYLIRPPRE